MLGEHIYRGAGSDCRAQWAFPKSLMLFRAQLYGLVQADSAIPWMTKNCTTPTIQAEYPIRTLTCPPSVTRIPCGQPIMRRRTQALRPAIGTGWGRPHPGRAQEFSERSSGPHLTSPVTSSATCVAHDMVGYTCAELHKVTFTRLAPHGYPKRRRPTAFAVTCVCGRSAAGASCRPSSLCLAGFPGADAGAVEEEVGCWASW